MGFVQTMGATAMGELDTCECGTFAIGLCGQCRKPMCIHHSRLLGGTSLCLSHYNAALDEKRARAAETAETASPSQDDAPSDQMKRGGRRTWGRRR